MSLVLSVALTLCACGGGSGGTGGGPPPPVTYTIGGTISGLSAQGLILQDNANDILNINSGANSFTFDKPVASGGSYDVTVVGDPASPTQFCVVSNASGIADMNIADIQVTCSTPAKKTLYSFGARPDGNNPIGSLAIDGAGNLYGATENGGAYNYGTVFRLTPNGGQWTETVLYSFCPIPNCFDGAVPASGLVLDAAGNLYGTTSAGGSYGYGAAFELTPQPNGAWTETVLHSFGSGTDGADPASQLLFDGAGNLYGTTSSGGLVYGPVCPDGCGIVYELSPGAGGEWVETVLHQFCSQADCADGGQSFAGVSSDSEGNLYGTTNLGGTPSDGQYGTVFELSPSGGGEWIEKTLYMFQGGGADGANPHAGVVLDKAGNLYGTTELGYETIGINIGTVFEVAHQSGGTWTETILYGFCAVGPVCEDGGTPYGGLVFDKDGNLYSTASAGGTSLNGVVFGLAPGPPNTKWIETPLYSFGGGSDGGSPTSGLVFDGSGNLYGVTTFAGINQNGTVFEVTP